MDEADDPYNLLGVSSQSNATEIRAAYRKLALQHHPDKQKTEDEKAAATVKFAKISNAYELLSDPVQRKQYDERHRQAFAGMNGFTSAPTSDFDDFFTSRRSAFPSHHSFRDPFQVFESFFNSEFGGGRDPFDPFGNRSRFGGSMFDNDPFFGQSPFGRPMGGGGMFPPFGGGMFGGGMFGGGRDPFEEMERHMQQNFSNSNNRNSNASSISYSVNNGNGMGQSVSTSTTTRIVNGKRQTVTERVIRKADGTVERHIETTGDDDFPSSNRLLGSGRGQAQPQLPGPNNDTHSQAVTTARKNSSRKSTKDVAASSNGLLKRRTSKANPRGSEFTVGAVHGNTSEPSLGNAGLGGSGHHQSPKRSRRGSKNTHTRHDGDDHDDLD